jgi:hypothetical protein
MNLWNPVPRRGSFVWGCPNSEPFVLICRAKCPNFIAGSFYQNPKCSIKKGVIFSWENPDV